jgi:hypothetical protein
MYPDARNLPQARLAALTLVNAQLGLVSADGQSELMLWLKTHWIKSIRCIAMTK